MRVTKAMRILNNDFDVLVKKAIRHTERVEKLKVQCRAGCNYCCNFLVIASVSEAMGMVEQLGFEKVRQLIPQLVDDSKRLADPSMTLAAWTDRWVPCHLLENGLCSAYDNRPFSCRSHVSFSVPEACNDPNGKSWMLEAAHPLCAQFTGHMDAQKMPAAMAPLQYQLLLMVYFEDHPDCEAEYERLRGTAALDLKQSLTAWTHLLEEPIDPETRAKMPGTAEIVPIWEHFEGKNG